MYGFDVREVQVSLVAASLRLRARPLFGAFCISKDDSACVVLPYASALCGSAKRGTLCDSCLCHSVFLAVLVSSHSLFLK